MRLFFGSLGGREGCRRPAGAVIWELGGQWRTRRGVVKGFVIAGCIFLMGIEVIVPRIRRFCFLLD